MKKTELKKLEQDNFEYTPLENFVKFELINSPDKDGEYIIVLKIFEKENENTVFNITTNEYGREIRHFDLNENEEINELLLKKVKFDPNQSIDGQKKAQYLSFLKNQLRIVSNSINSYIEHKNLIKTKDKNDLIEKEYSDSEKNMLLGLDLYYLMDDNYSVPTSINGTKRVSPFLFELFPDGQQFDTAYLNYNKNPIRTFNHKITIRSSTKIKEKDNNHYYNFNNVKTISFKKKLKRHFIDEGLRFDEIIEIPSQSINDNQSNLTDTQNKQVNEILNQRNNYLANLKNDTWPPEEVTYREKKDIDNNKKIENPNLGND